MAQDTACICVLIGTAICKSGECNKKNAELWEQEQDNIPATPLVEAHFGLVF